MISAMKARPAVIASWLLVGLTICGFSFDAHYESATEAHAPIVIGNDREFTIDNGVRSGSGTESDPYLISGWDIDTSSSDGIYIHDTSARFVISSVDVEVNSSLRWAGVHLERVGCGVVRNCTLAGGAYGVDVVYSSNVSVMGNNISGNLFGSIAYWSEAIEIERNIVQDCLIGLESNASWDVHISTNTVLRCSIMALGVTYYSYDVTVANNLLMESAIGISLEGTYDTRVHGNAIVNNSQQAYNELFVGNEWNTSYPIGGNYWSDYSGIDVMSGLFQDNPSSDGIGDTPYVINAYVSDHYPLMNPWGSNPPVADFSFSPSSVLVGCPVTFNGSASYDRDGSLINFTWTLAHNGSQVTSFGEVMTFVFDLPGTYEINLTVRDSQGLESTLARDVVVEEAAIPEFPGLLMPVLVILFFSAVLIRAGSRPVE